VFSGRNLQNFTTTHLFFSRWSFYTRSRLLSYCARKLVLALALLKNKKKSHGTLICCPHVAARPLFRPKQTLSGLVTSLILSPTLNLYSLDIKLCLWRRVEVSCFITTTADAINKAKPCRAVCDYHVCMLDLPKANQRMLLSEIRIDDINKIMSITGIEKSNC